MELHLISLFHNTEKESDNALLNDATVEDLDLEEFFWGTDYTQSCPGRQYLYHILHYSKRSWVSEQESLICKLSEDKALQLLLDKQLEKLDRSDAYYIPTLFSKPLPQPSKKRFRLLSICRFVPFILCGLMFIFHIKALLLLFIASLVLNALLHYREKAKVQEYCFSIPQLVKLIEVAEKLVTEKEFLQLNPNIETTLRSLKELQKHLKSFKWSIRLESDLALLAYFFTELFNVFFLTEAYSINRTFVLLKDKQQQLKDVFTFVARLDLLRCISLLRKEFPYYCLPTYSENPQELIAEGVYHPMIYDAVDNDLRVSTKSVLITGSNMSGKTSFIRTIGINLITGNVLNTCFAKNFCTPTDMKIASAIHTVDNLMEGKSYFLREVEQVKQLIEDSQQGNYLFLLDEPFKGTNTKERIAIGKAVLAALVKNNNIVFISTHDLELAALQQDTYELYYFNESVASDVLSFDYKMKKGVASEKNAIKILEIFDYPEEIVRDAYNNS